MEKKKDWWKTLMSAKEKMRQDRFVDRELLGVPSGRWADNSPLGGRGVPARTCDVRVYEDAQTDE
jgi:hypothetical protein